MENIAENLKILKQQIYAVEQKYGRLSGSVKLLAVTKGHPVDDIKQAIEADQLEFGENYLQEALSKLNSINRKDVSWHFIGPIQSNKTTQLAQNFDWIHTLDRDKVARRLNQARPVDRGPLNVCIQVNISGETTKAGIAPAEVKDFSDFILTLPALRLRGLMFIPAITPDFKAQRQVFSRARNIYETLLSSGLKLDTLSMGMSNDFEAAIAEGSTMIRIGTAIFGPRHT